ncbi:MAG: DNA-binding protein [Saprospiraceae bacterium]|nr:DNA-binding protein [Bacteroidia bacterium]NNE14043.1 DNA-binding protein [Saprospiraceae bacterium]NNL92782.1 DNA-binding protein [Saprospiraceae bacterium]
MYITYDELRTIKHRLPTGSISRIAKTLQVEEQSVRNYFGANKYSSDDIIGRHIQPGPKGGVVHIENTEIIELARQIISESQSN